METHQTAMYKVSNNNAGIFSTQINAPLTFNIGGMVHDVIRISYIDLF